MDLSTLIQIPCHHVLANKIALNLKYRIGLKHFFNINLGIGIIIIKNYFFVCIFDISPCVFTQILIERARWMRNLIPHLMSTHTAYFWWTPLPQKQEMPEKTWWWHHYHIFSDISYFWGRGSIKSMQCGYSLDAELNFASNELSRLKFE